MSGRGGGKAFGGQGNPPLPNAKPRGNTPSPAGKPTGGKALSANPNLKGGSK